MDNFRHHTESYRGLSDKYRVAFLDTIAMLRPPKQRRVVLVFGMVQTKTAERYADAQTTDRDRVLFSVSERVGRDNIRIGEMMRQGFRVYGISKGYAPDAINRLDADVMINSGDSSRSRGLIPRLKLTLNGDTVDCIADEWYYIPPSYSTGGDHETFYDPGKWYNIVAMKENGLLAPDARVVIPAHRDAIKVIFGNSDAANRVRTHLKQHFEFSFVVWSDEAGMLRNPLWAATARPSAFFQRFPTRGDDTIIERFHQRVAQNLRDVWTQAEDMVRIHPEWRNRFDYRKPPLERIAFIELHAMTEEGSDAMPGRFRSERRRIPRLGPYDRR